MTRPLRIPLGVSRALCGSEGRANLFDSPRSSRPSLSDVTRRLSCKVCVSPRHEGVILFFKTFATSSTGNLHRDAGRIWSRRVAAPSTRSARGGDLNADSVADGAVTEVTLVSVPLGYCCPRLRTTGWTVPAALR